MKNEKVKRSIKKIENYLSMILEKMSDDPKEKKIDNALFVINFLTETLLNTLKEIEFFKAYSNDVIANLVEITHTEKTIDIDYSKILYAIDSLYSVSDIKYTTPDSVLIDEHVRRYVEDVKKAVKFCKTSFEKTGDKIMVF